MQKFLQGALQACLVTSITNCLVHNSSSSPTESHDAGCYLRRVVSGRFEAMPWMMAMFVARETQDAKVEVRTVLASHKFMLGQFWQTISLGKEFTRGVN